MVTCFVLKRFGEVMERKLDYVMKLGVDRMKELAEVTIELAGATSLNGQRATDKHTPLREFQIV